MTPSHETNHTKFKIWQRFVVDILMFKDRSILWYRLQIGLNYQMWKADVVYNKITRINVNSSIVLTDTESGFWNREQRFFLPFRTSQRILKCSVVRKPDPLWWNNRYFVLKHAYMILICVPAVQHCHISSDLRKESIYFACFKLCSYVNLVRTAKNLSS